MKVPMPSPDKRWHRLIRQFMKTRFQTWGVVTVVSVYLLILVGGIVRSTGSGMGCPDWPKCFGTWIPPTEVSALPENYREVYAEKRKTKNEKLGKYLEKLGFKELAFQITHDPSIYQEQPFNATKTWIEYLNRLLGALIGLFIFLTLIFSFSYWKTDRTITWLSFATFILVGVQGWIGSVVVSTNLLPGLITLHMMLAIAVVFLQIFAVVRSLGQVSDFQKVNKNLNWILAGVLLISLIQIIFGTQVRQAIDIIANQLGENRRDDWVENVGMKFYLHRSFSWLVLFANAYLVFILRKQPDLPKNFTTFGYILLFLIGIEFVSGVAMAWFGIPAFLQPIHLTLATVSVGIQFGMLIWMNPETFGLQKKQIAENQEISI